MLRKDGRMKNQCSSVVPIIIFSLASLPALRVSACHTNVFCGIGQFRQEIVLTATTNAPAGASGKAELVNTCSSGTNAALLKVQTCGLSNGTYSVSITDTAGVDSVLGTFDVGIFTNRSHWGCLPKIVPPWIGLGPGFGHGRARGFDFDKWTNRFDFGSCSNQIDFSAWTNHLDIGAITNCLPALTNWLDGASWTNICGVFPRFHFLCGRTNNCARAAFALPSGMATGDVASVSIVDSNAVVDLEGTFITVTNSVTDTVAALYNGQSTVQAGPAGASVTGQATLTIQTENGRSRGKFLLVATGAPAKQKYTLVVDGATVGRARSDKQGNIVIKKLPKADLATVTSVVVKDSGGTVVLSVTF
jgi:hypothetical protein